MATIQPFDRLSVFTPWLPTGIRPEWPIKRGYACRCGFTDSHPICAVCGLAIGPDHVRRSGALRPIPVWVDTFNEQFGFWEVLPRTEQRMVCVDCITRHRPIRPIRHCSRPINRLTKINAWRRRRGLSLLVAAEESQTG